MTPTAEERAEAAAIDVEGRQARLAQVLGDDGAGDTSAGSTKPAGTIMGKCPDCGMNAFFIGRNRLSNCGHVRRSHGKLIPAHLKAEPAAQVAGGLSRDQADTLRQLLKVIGNSGAMAIECNRQHEAACKEFDAYLDSLVAK